MVQKWNDEGIIELHTLGLNEKCFSKYIISLKSIVINFGNILHFSFSFKPDATLLISVGIEKIGKVFVTDCEIIKVRVNCSVIHTRRLLCYTL